MYNSISLVGRLAAKPEIRFNPSGKQVASAKLAVDRKFRDKQSGEKVTDWFKVEVWGNPAETFANNCDKGDIIAVEGELQLQSWTGQDGKQHTQAVVAQGEFRFIHRKQQGQQHADGGESGAW